MAPKQDSQVFGLEDLKEDIKVGITKKVLEPIQNLGEECTHINEALDLLTVQDILNEPIPAGPKKGIKHDKN